MSYLKLRTDQSKLSVTQLFNDTALSNIFIFILK